MEPWQKAHVTKHLVDLQEQTICNQALISRLESLQMLSKEDIDTLNTYQQQYEKTRVLYKYLETRVGAYEVLIKVLFEVCQTGAANILQKAYQTFPRHILDLTFDKSRLLGRGCQNTKVYEGRFGDICVAVKVINCDDIEKPVAMKEVERFGQLIMHSSENIIRYYHAKEEGENLYIALELCDGNLAECIKHNKIEISAPIVLRQTTEGLNFLHTNKIIHLDLKPENILLKRKHDLTVVAKIADFGIAKKFTEDDKSVLKLPTSSGLGTLGWLAPELQKTKENPQLYASRASDVFSLGCVFYYVLSNGEHPFGDEWHCMANIADGKVQMRIAHIPEGLLDYFWLIRLMINKTPIQRPGTHQILNHPIYWDPDITLKFISEIRHFLKNKNAGLSKICLNNCTQFLKKVASASRVLSNTWLSLLCPAVQQHISSVHPEFLQFDNPLQQLIFTISQLYEDYAHLPEPVRNCLGKLPQEFQLYWTSRFPFLISCLWLHFEKMRTESRLAFYYGDKFHDSYNSPSAQLGIIEAYITAGNRVNFYKELQHIRKAARLEPHPLDVIEESESTMECSSTENLMENTAEMTKDMEAMSIENSRTIGDFNGAATSFTNNLVRNNSVGNQQPNYSVPNPPLLLRKVSKDGPGSVQNCSEAKHADVQQQPMTPWNLAIASMVTENVQQLETACNALEKDENRKVTEILKKLDDNNVGTILHQAVKKGSMKCVQYLLGHQGFHSALEAERMHDLLHICVANTAHESNERLEIRTEIVKLLVSKKKELIYEKNQHGETPLHVSGIHLKLLITLIAAGGDVFTSTRKKLTVMHTAPNSCSNGEDFHRLVQGMNRNFLIVFSMKSNSGKLPLHHAIMRFEVLKKTLVLLESNGLLDLNACDDNGITIFMQAIIGQRTSDYLEFLCGEFKAEKQKIDDEKRSGLHIAALHGNVSALTYFIRECPQLKNCLDARGRTPLHCCFLSGHENLMAITHELVIARVQVNARTDRMSGCKTALHLLFQMQAKFEHQISSDVLWEVASFLVENGADPGIKDSEGNTCFHIAFEYSQNAVIKNVLMLWTSFEAFITARNELGETPLHKLFKRKKYVNIDLNVIIQIITEKFSDFLNVNIKDNENNSIMDLANLLFQSGHIDNERMKLLKELFM